jgi:putative membrane protein
MHSRKRLFALLLCATAGSACASEARQPPQAAARAEQPAGGGAAPIAPATPTGLAPVPGAPAGAPIPPAPPASTASPVDASAGAAAVSDADPGRGATDSNSASVSDPQIVGLAVSISDAQVANARLARVRANGDSVKKLAAMLLARHELALRKQKELKIEPQESALSTEFEVRAESDRRKLDKVTGDEFDRAYLDLQIDWHRRLLEVLERQLLGSARDAQVRSLLWEVKPKLEEQLSIATQARQGLSQRR